MNGVTEKNPKLLHTLLREDVYDRLIYLAQSMHTGRGHWDFGVAIELLLNEFERTHRFDEIEARLDSIENEKTTKEVNNSKTDENPLGLIGKRFKKTEGEKNGKI